MALKEPETQQLPRQDRRQTMNIKIAAYAITAVLMGFTIMMLPLALETGPPTYEPKLQPLQPSFAGANRYSEGTDEQQSALTALNGLASQPSNFLPTSLIMLTGLAVALSVYITLKKQLS